MISSAHMCGAVLRIMFDTVFSSGADNDLVDSICENLYGTSCKIYATDEHNADNNLVYKQALSLG